jgi:hypothetical protein
MPNLSCKRRDVNEKNCDGDSKRRSDGFRLPSLSAKSLRVAACQPEPCEIGAVKSFPLRQKRATDTLSEHAHAQSASSGVSWVRLFERVFNIDIEYNPTAATF